MALLTSVHDEPQLRASFPPHGGTEIDPLLTGYVRRTSLIIGRSVAQVSGAIRELHLQEVTPWFSPSRSYSNSPVRYLDG